MLYAASSTRPDINHAVNVAARSMTAPTHANMTATRHILKYISCTLNHHLVYNCGDVSECEVTAYCDADWGGDKEERKSTTGYCTFINNNLITWRTRKQQTVAQSTAEAEFMAIADAVNEVQWLSQLVSEIGVTVKLPMIIYCDNQSAIQAMVNDGKHSRMKHVDIQVMMMKEKVRDGTVRVEWVRTENQLADVFTKALPTPAFTYLVSKLMTEEQL